MNLSRHLGPSLVLAASLLAAPAQAKGPAPGLGVGAQYDTTHVYLDSSDHYDAFVNSFIATFGGQPSPRITANIMPVDNSSTQAQYVWTPAGTLSTFAFQTPIPWPFGTERNGYLVSDMDAALKAARAAGAEVVVDKFKDPIGYDAVVRWPGGVNMQFYWHFTAPSYGKLDTVPDNRVYVSADRAEAFLRSFLKFSHGKVVSDEKKANAGEIGRPGDSYRRIRLESVFGRMQVMVSDGHLPWPFGWEMTGYEVKDLPATLDKAKASGARLLYGPYDAGDRDTAIVQFPGGYIAEIHDVKAR